MLFIGSLIYSSISSKARVEDLQQKIRDVEWNSILKFIEEKNSGIQVTVLMTI